MRLGEKLFGVLVVIFGVALMVTLVIGCTAALVALGF